MFKKLTKKRKLYYLSKTNQNESIEYILRYTLISVISGDLFTIVNEAGEDGQGRGLLLYDGKTVCDDGFSDNSSAAICGLMGYDGFDSWTNGQLFEIQASLEIGLDDVVCSSGSWDSCSFTTTENCGHSEDVHLNCVPEGIDFI